MYQHILLPTDGSELSGRAVKAGIEFAQSLNARVTGLYAAPHSRPAIYREIPLAPDAQAVHDETAQSMGKKYLAVIESLAQALRVPHEEVIVISDSPFQAIIETALAKRCDLIFMAPRASESPLGLSLGSNTQKVLAYSKIPVLVHR